MSNPPNLPPLATLLPGSFPQSPEPSPPLSPRSVMARDVRSSSLSRGRGLSTTNSTGGVQTRRSGVSLGLGVSFAPPPNGASWTSATLSTPGDSSRPRTASTASSTRSTSLSRSRRSSLTTTPTFPASSEMGAQLTATMSRRPSRRPSLSNLGAFLSGVEHHTRVRNPGVIGGRGVSRSASRSQSRAGEGRHSQEDSERDYDYYGMVWGGGSSAMKGATSRTSSLAAHSRRGSLSGYQLPLTRDQSGSGSSNDMERSVGSLWEAGERGTVTEEVEHLSSTAKPTPLISSLSSQTYVPVSTPRLMSPSIGAYPYSGEEPFLDTAPSSPVPRRTHTHDSFSNGLEDVEVFDEGDRVGVGVWLEGRGGWARDCFGDSRDGTEPGNGIGGPGELEIVRRLGEGTYAIVYLVREVLYDPDPNEDDALSPIDSYSSFPSDYNHHDAQGKPVRPMMHSWASDPFTSPRAPTYGRSFALKCLCKKDLTDELIEVQRGEAVLHRALPDHEYIVRLYGAYETDDWLFLVLEYCPGQDLFYWLDERQDDSVALYDLHSRAASPFQAHQSPSTRRRSLRFDDHDQDLDDDDEALLSRTVTSNGDSDRTPPSPTLLSSTANASLLSRKRLRLISRMFGQMCAAVQACHEVGIAHRDIKPENFIVMDGRGEGESGVGRVVVKITDWGLGTRESECEDFDCGSKPYMAYECRNNLRPTYDPRQADVWSLGLVLLNLLYHRNPWADPSLDDPDFAEYVRDPRAFLQDRFEGIGTDVAGYLADRVFCDVLEMEGTSMRTRVTAGEFGRWAGRLVIMMGAGMRKRASVSEQTFHLFSTVVRPSPGSKSPPVGPHASLLSQYAPHTSISPVPFEDVLPNVVEGKEVDFARVESHRPSPIMALLYDENDSALPSPSFPADKPLFSAPVSPLPQSPSRLAAAPLIPSPLASPPVTLASSPALTPALTPALPSPPLPILVPLREHRRDGGGLRCYGEPEAQNPNRRGKRGARKGKAAQTPGETSPSATPRSPASPQTVPTAVVQRDRVLADLAAASQDLARELSKATRSFGTQSTSALSSATSTLAPPKKIEKPKSNGVFDRMRNLVKDGNPDLQAFKQRVDERNASIGAKADTYSAPAKMQGRGVTSGGSIEGGISTRGSVGQGSWGSVSGADVEEAARGRTREDLTTVHWSSASSRRDRLEQQRQRPQDLSPASSTRNGTLSTSTFDSRQHTPLSSFSSVGEESLPPSVAGTVRDWRQPSPHARGYSTSRPPPPTRVVDTHHQPLHPPNTVVVVVAPPKPQLKDACTDTMDLGSSPLPVYSAPRTAPLSPHLTPASPTKANRSLSPATRTSSPATSPSNPVDVPIKSPTKLAKMLNSISVFNRTQERDVPRA